MARRNKDEDPRFTQFRDIVLIQFCLDQMPELDAPLDEISGVDDLDITEMVMDCEAVFGIEVDDDRLADLKNLGQVWRSILAQTSVEQKAEAATA